MFMKEKSRTFSNVLRQVLVCSGFRVFCFFSFCLFKVSLWFICRHLYVIYFFLGFRQITHSRSCVDLNSNFSLYSKSHRSFISCSGSHFEWTKLPLFGSIILIYNVFKIFIFLSFNIFKIYFYFVFCKNTFSIYSRWDRVHHILTSTLKHVLDLFWFFH